MLSKTYTKYIQSLHHKKFRDAGNSFIAEGTKVVIELLSAGRFECEQLLGKEEWLKQNESNIRKFYKGPIQVLEFHELEKISALNTTNEIIGVFKKAVPKDPVFKNRIVLVLDAIQDPGNLGTIIRIADWFGIRDIICSDNSVELYNPKVVQGTMGSISRVNVSYGNIAGIMEEHTSIRTYATALEGKSIRQFQEIKEGIIIIGNESKGISEQVMQLANEKITIPKIGLAESLNAAVATGIILSHVVNLKM